MAIHEVDLSIPTMSCENCAETIEATLSPVAGVSDVKVDLKAKRVAIRFDGSRVTEKQLEAALGKAGFAIARA